jgi:hypothetical protein
MRIVFLACTTAIALGIWAGIAFDKPEWIAYSGGVVALVTAMGAAYLLTRAPSITDSARKLQDLIDLVDAERAAQLTRNMHERDRLDQLTLIVLSGVGAALQAFANGILALWRFVAG